jgi:hypothetical protein
MAPQEVSRELDVPWYGSVFIYCGTCAVERPSERLRRIGKAGGQRLEQTARDFVREALDQPGVFASSKYVDPDSLVKDQPDEWWKTAKFRKIRTGVLFEARYNADRIDYAGYAADVAERQGRVNPKDLDQIVNEELGFQRTSASPYHLSLVRLKDDEPNSLLTCWKFGTKMTVGREWLAMAVEHVKEFDGKILVFPTTIDVRESRTTFGWKNPHRPKRWPSRRHSGRATS